MNRHFSRVPVAFAASLALGCASGESPTASNEPPSLDVVHDDLVVGFIGGDFRYTVYVGTSLDDLIHHCTQPGRPGFNLPTWDELLVNRPDGSIKELLKTKQVDITVFEVPYFPVFADECDPLASRHFTGTGTARTAANDETFTHPTITGSLIVKGTVVGQDGQQYRLQWTTHSVQTATSTPPPAQFIDRIKLTPIPR